ncbi:unnamed protein product [Hymenolepis diminuta]|uniref:Uncharacterized protein n=1 Tax=Hymenolepis diminuta TaxID=6216 RepID=A0A564XWB8_HYMDI|nr:unnamed protein product [Hymenolepis diminuta]
MVLPIHLSRSLSIVSRDFDGVLTFILELVVESIFTGRIPTLWPRRTSIY